MVLRNNPMALRRIPKNPPKSYPLYKEFIKLGLKSEVNRNPLR
jgi:hypothetical protein